MSPDDNKAILRAYVETIFNQQQLDRADELVAADYVDHAALPGQAPGLGGGEEKWAMYLAGISRSAGHDRGDGGRRGQGRGAPIL